MILSWFTFEYIHDPRLFVEIIKDKKKITHLNTLLYSHCFDKEYKNIVE